MQWKQLYSNVLFNLKKKKHLHPVMNWQHIRVFIPLPIGNQDRLQHPCDLSKDYAVQKIHGLIKKKQLL